MKLKLSTPINAHGETVTELEFRDPTARDLRDLPVSGLKTFGDMYPIISSVAGIPPSSVDQLSAVDIVEAMNFIAPFFDRSATSTGD